MHKKPVPAEVASYFQRSLSNHCTVVTTLAIDIIVPAVWFKAGADNDSSFANFWLIILPFPSYVGSQLFDTVKDLSRSKSPAIGEAGELDTGIMPRKVGNGSTKGSDAFPCSPCVVIAGLGTL